MGLFGWWKSGTLGLTIHWFSLNIRPAIPTNSHTSRPCSSTYRACACGSGANESRFRKAFKNCSKYQNQGFFVWLKLTDSIFHFICRKIKTVLFNNHNHSISPPHPPVYLCDIWLVFSGNYWIPSRWHTGVRGQTEAGGQSLGSAALVCCSIFIMSQEFRVDFMPQRFQNTSC